MVKSQEEFFKIIFLSTLAAFIVGGYVIWSKKSSKKKPYQLPIPKKWRKVGKISKINLFPLKSGKYKSLDSAFCTKLGIMEEDTAGKLSLMDRSFVVFDEVTKDKITIRDYPKMLFIEVKALDEDTVMFSSPGSDDLKIKVPNSTHVKEERNFIIMWDKEEICTVDCGEEASNWLTKILTKEGHNRCRLGYYVKDVLPPRSTNGLRPNKKKVYSKMDDDYLGMYSDLSSYMVMTKASMDDLNSRLDTPVSEINFRPNIFVEDTETPFEEDDWDWLKLGEDTVLRSFKYCNRCIVTTTDPFTAIRNPDLEPLKTLRTYRIAMDPEVKKVEGQSPLMGINMGLHKTGVIRVGDPVFVNSD